MTSRPIQQLALGFCLLVFSLLAQAAIQLSDPMPVDPQIRVGKLGNGLSYYIKKNAKPEKRLELRLVVKAGSLQEDDDQQGLAHFAEHMAFNGSRHFKKHELVSYLQSIGMKFGGDLNAHTSFEETVYMLTAPTDKPENIDTSFLVLQDWAQGVQMADEAIDSERNIVLEELRRGQGAGDRINKQVLPAVFNGSRYAERLPIGQESLLKTFPYAAVRRFYSDWYRPDLMAVVVVGDIEPARAEALIHQHFGALKNPSPERVHNRVIVPPYSQAQAVVATDAEQPRNSVQIYFPTQPRQVATRLADARIDLIRGLSDLMLAERLRDLAQQETPPFPNASGMLQAMNQSQEQFILSMGVGQRGVEVAVQAGLAEVNRIRQFGFNVQELERARKAQLSFLERAFNERDKTESGRFAAEYIRNFLVAEAIPGIANEYAWARELLPGITVEEVNAFFRTKVPATAATLAVYAGSAKDTHITPSTEKLQTIVQAASAQAVVQTQAKALPQSLMASAPPAGTIVSESHNAALGLTTLTLSNGVRVILKPSDFKNDEVLLAANRFGGQSLYSDADDLNAKFASALVPSMGLDAFTPSDVRKILAGKVATLNQGIGETHEFVSGNSSRGDMETMFQTLYLRMRTQRKDDALFKNWVEERQNATRNQMSNPMSAFMDFALKTLLQNHPRVAGLPQPEDFAKVNLERSMAIYRERLGSAKGMAFTLVGSFAVDQVKPLIATYLASLPVPDIPVQYKDLGIRPVGGIVKKTLHLGKDNKALAVLFFSGPAAYSPDEVARLNLLNEVLNLKITEVLREQRGLIYAGNAQGSLSRAPYESYTITVGAPCAPANVDAVVQALLTEIERLQTEGPQPEDLAKVKKNASLGVQMSARTNAFWSSTLAESVMYGNDPSPLLDTSTRLQRIERITPADIQAAAQRYFKKDNYVQMVMLPEKKAE